MAGNQEKRYWKSLAELERGEDWQREAETEFAETPLQSIEPSRRSFLKAAGFAFGGVALSGCGSAPRQTAVPHLDQPEGVIAGRSVYYASTCGGCAAGCGVLVKVRDGRPIKLEGNPEHPVSRGGLCAVGQASILGLYDSLRLKEPLLRGKAVKWEAVDGELRKQMDALRARGGAVRFLTGTITSPTERDAIDRFVASFRDGRRVSYDAMSSSAILDAHERTHGVRVLPRLDFSKADVIVSFDADFLGAWISPVEHTAGYREGRDPEAKPPRLSYHVQFEGRMSLTGTKADRRIAIAPDEMPHAITQLAARIAAKTGAAFAPVAADAELDSIAERLWNARGRSLVVCGLQDVDAQAVCNYVNHLLGNYGATLDLNRPSYQRSGSDRELAALAEEVDAGKVAALFTYGCNPVYDLPGGERWKKIPLLVSFAERRDETAAAAHVVCPVPHYLESWTDAEPVRGVVAVSQPAIRQLGNTRPLVETMATWMGAPKPAYNAVRERWETQVAWNETVERGFAILPSAPAQARSFNVDAVRPANAEKRDGYVLALYATPAMLDGRHAYNPWLQELPDPVTKVTWDNCASISPGTAARLGVRDGDIVRPLELPVLVQPGQHDRVIAVALGYGNAASERFARIGPRWLDAKPSTGGNGLVGRNAAPLLALEGGLLRYTRAVQIEKTGGRSALACTQDHHTLTVPEKLAPPGAGARPIVQETSLGAQAEAGHESHPDLWPRDHEPKGHRWGMVVDLNACTGCSACVVACQVENNIPVVGKDEARRKRIMHWMRVDRYYSGAPDNVQAAHQPMFCQQCEHAGCETVCPVLATVHSSEGLNQQVYNRCVGTRYCANNCAFKARRFNWFDYPREDRLANLVLNPDVTVRSRGVMEKCTFCVQRIQEAKIEARRRGEPLRDGEIQTACQQSCPAKAIVFGDMNDPNSKVSDLMHSGRPYRVLEEYNLRPSVTYLKVVRHG